MDDVFKREAKVVQIGEELIDSGEFESINDVRHYEELLKEYKSLLNQARRLVKISDLMELKLKHVSQSLEEISNRDFLTNLANRRYFEEIMKKEWFRALRVGSSIGIIMIDIDHFKDYNDTYGHSEGDRCLQNIAHVISQTARRHSDLAARYGGEEFIMLLPETDLEGTKNLAQLLAANIAKLNLPHGKSPIDNKISVSMGIASIIPKEDNVYDILILKADEALYLAKASGKNCIREYS